MDRFLLGGEKVMKTIISLLFICSIAYSQALLYVGADGKTYKRTHSGDNTGAGYDTEITSSGGSVDSNSVATRYWVGSNYSNWTTIETTSDTTLAAANITFTPLGVLHFTMTASTPYAVEGRIYYKRATAGNGVTLALNVGGTPTDLGFIISAADNTTDGTDMIKTARVTTATDSIQLINSTVTTRDFIDFTGTLTCDASNRLFGFRWHLEVASSGVTIMRGSYLRYRKIY